ncbi:MAG: GntR family transcriptional regulator [Chloroflexota bacterium]
MLIERPKPVVDQVNTILRQRIRDQVYPPGARLPSESELAQALQVSRATIRTVLAKLAAEGLIIRRQGDGTFVNQRIGEVNTSLGGMLDFSRLITSSGYTPTIQTIAAEERLATTDEAKRLGITAVSPILALQRLFLADAQPVILATNIIAKSLFTDTQTAYDGNLPIHKFLQVYCNEEIAYGIYDVGATLATEPVHRWLKKGIGKPLLKLSTTFYNKANQPLAYGISYYDDVQLRLRLVQAWG